MLPLKMTNEDPEFQKALIFFRLKLWLAVHQLFECIGGFNDGSEFPESDDSDFDRDPKFSLFASMMNERLLISFDDDDDWTQNKLINTLMSSSTLEKSDNKTKPSNSNKSISFDDDYWTQKALKYTLSSSTSVNSEHNKAKPCSSANSITSAANNSSTSYKSSRNIWSNEASSETKVPISYAAKVKGNTNNDRSFCLNKSSIKLVPFSSVNSYAAKVKANINKEQNQLANRTQGNKNFEHARSYSSSDVFYSASSNSSSILDCYCSYCCFCQSSLSSSRSSSPPVESPTTMSSTSFEDKFIRHFKVSLILSNFEPVLDASDLYRMCRLNGLMANLTKYNFDEINEDTKIIDAASKSEPIEFYPVISPFHTALFGGLFEKLPVISQLRFRELFFLQGHKFSRQYQVSVTNMTVLLAFMRHAIMKLKVVIRKENDKRAQKSKTSCVFCRLADHINDDCPVRQATICHKCFSFGHTVNHCDSEPLFPLSWLKIGDAIYKRAIENEKNLETDT